MNALAAAFEKKTGVKVDSKVVSRDDYTAQVQLAVPLPPRSDDGDMNRSGRMSVGRPRPGHPGGRQSQIGPEEPTHSVRHLQGDIAVHRPG